MLLLFCLILAEVNLYSQSRVTHIDNVKNYSGNGGIYYALPRTVIQVNVHVVKTDNYKGPYSAFAAKYFGIKDFIQYDNTKYEIAGIELCSYTEPDTDHVYFVEVEDKDSKREKQISLLLSESGIIQGVNTESEYNEPEKINCDISGFSLKYSPKKDDSKEIFKQFITNNYVEIFDTVSKIISVDDTSTIEKKVLQSRLIEKSPEQKAEEISQKIYRIQTERNNLLTGYQETAYTMESIKYMNEQLEEIEKGLLELFIGVTIKKDKKYSFKYIPVTGASKEADVIFKFSEASGVVDKYANKGDEIKIVLNSSGIGKIIDESSKQKRSQANDGFYYRFPEYCDISVVDKNETLAEGRMLIEQYGSLIKLAPNKSSILYHKNSGNIKRFEVK